MQEEEKGVTGRKNTDPKFMQLKTVYTFENSLDRYFKGMRIHQGTPTTAYLSMNMFERC